MKSCTAVLLVCVAMGAVAVNFRGDIKVHRGSPTKAKTYEVICTCPHQAGMNSTARLTRYCCNETAEMNVGAFHKFDNTKGKSAVATYYFTPGDFISVNSKSVYIRCDDNLNFLCQCYQAGQEIFSRKLNVVNNTIQGCSVPFQT